MISRPDRLTVPTCIGCGAMGIFGSCETGCREERLDLVPAQADDELVALTSQGARAVEAFRVIAEDLAGEPEGEAAAREAYRDLQRVARAALRDHPPVDWVHAALDAPATPATAWWCPECGGLEAPQPCIGVCIWRPAEWTTAERHEQARDRAREVRALERELRRLVERVARVTPRDGHWAHTWRALAGHAARALEAARS